MRPLSRTEVRAVDRRASEEFGISGLILMENAGRACVETLCSLGCRGPVTIVCGKGNNAGDGFVIARHLESRDVPAQVVLLGSPGDLRGDAAVNFAMLERCGLPIVDLSSDFNSDVFGKVLQGAEWIVDALLGTGATGPPRPPFAAAIRQMNAAPSRRLAVDLPSGLDCDTGEPADPTFRADHTCTFVAPKIGFANPKAAQYLGKVHVLNLGTPRQLLPK